MLRGPHELFFASSAAVPPPARPQWASHQHCPPSKRPCWLPKPPSKFQTTLKTNFKTTFKTTSSHEVTFADARPSHIIESGQPTLISPLSPFASCSIGNGAGLDTVPYATFGTVKE
ncbi:hypothetical protein PLESTB_000279200 [Pleodorina starrii]|uniref:Uncharacterized protein n=1 Tax=Pleodorina starrii TaxID=330485 RepID=A0A9W6BDR3_9CHLO|nr:hypothetical protein PLESTM_001410100 [Pleodorina starrii]GLC49717.1 hypothetical protein PLESTB_000279200 [Pleodorina starrii]GLC76018.1 hypothetical protein PLESTF_001721100 [Pleodorina starrii]